MQDGQSSQRDGYAEDGSPHPEQAGDGSRGDGDHNLRQAGLGFKLGGILVRLGQRHAVPRGSGGLGNTGGGKGAVQQLIACRLSDQAADRDRQGKGKDG